MLDVLIVVESIEEDITIQMVSALKHAISSTHPQLAIEVIPSADVESATPDGKMLEDHFLICPLTLNLPDWLVLPGLTVYQACRDVSGLQQRLVEWSYPTGAGNFWLPIVLTAKGPLYGEVIGVDVEPSPQFISSPSTRDSSPRYRQPVHLPDSWRQPLYKLGHRLLRSLSAPPAVYLMQFGFQEQSLCFDRLLPFPTAPAISSLGIQAPDLFTCHWLCLSGQPIRDLVIDASIYYTHER